MALGWFRDSDGPGMFLAGLSMLAGVLAWRWGFTRLVRRNVARIWSLAPGKERVCIFAFQNVRSYLLVGVMMTLGFLLRHSALPRLALAPAYLAMGVTLLLSSLGYYRAAA